MKIGRAFIFGLVVVLWFFFRGGEAEPESDEAVQVHIDDEPAPKTSSVPGVKLIERNPFIEEFGRNEGDDLKDLQALRDIVTDCQLYLKEFDKYHLPGNPEIIRFLQGDNPEKLAWIPLNHRSLNEGGELVDRHGTPVFFHRLSGMRFEFRSAGPDGKHWTEDDVIVR